MIKRHIGQILLDGRFLSRSDLERALDEQKQTKELLGQVLVRMGVLKARDVNAPLMVQEHLSHLEDAVRIAAGERQLLGALLVQSGRITGDQLDQAISEQKRTGEKLGEIFTRLGMLTERQLAALLDFQQNQTEKTPGPLRLGELLVATGHISREQLEKALSKQALSRKKLGEVLVEEGYARPGQITHGIRLQKMLVNSVLAAILSLSMSSAASAASVKLQWDPNTETDLAGYKVYYAEHSASLDGVTPIVVQNGTTATINGLDPGKSYRFAVTAYNTADMESGMSNVLTVAEITPPTVEITSPADANNVSGTVSINVSADDNVGVTKVEFYINNQLKGADTASPYLYSWDTSTLPQGAYTLMAKAYDAAGNVSQSSKTVTVLNDTIPPTVAVTAPADNAVVSGGITIKANAVDNVGVSMVEIYANGVLLFAGNAAPYNFTWDTRSVANGSYILTARASDNKGNIANSSTVTVTVANQVADTTAPTISAFTLPATAASLTVPVAGFTATDNVAVTGFMITESATPPAAGAAGWSASAPASITFGSAGAKTVYAWVKDAGGNVSAASSAAVIITLQDKTAPTISAFTLPATAASLTVPVTGLTAADNVAVTGYMITESSTPPSADAAGWSASIPTSITFGSAGAKTAYAWVKDASGNVSAASTATVAITLPNNAPAPAPATENLTIVDATLAVQASIGKIQLTNEQKSRLDVAPVVNGVSKPNAKVDTGDAIVILSKLVGKIAK
ncbi:Ig-like domain-containing protein [Geobacter sp. OR-1]|uniref:Ig-like domain-containing protein n=1 Tax=Geobacter sp. OR-1 TaxID=1266765 RepID=UPI001364DAEA|nr:Ig-like domain-containing protein [Geobacter sp. OR-1]